MTDEQFKSLVLHLRLIFGALCFIGGVLIAFAWHYL